MAKLNVMCTEAQSRDQGPVKMPSISSTYNASYTRVDFKTLSPCVEKQYLYES